MNIENWEKLQAPEGMFAPPDDGLIVRGTVFGHPEIKDGTVMTVNLIGYDFQNAAFVTASGAEYRLKTPSTSYSAMFPNPIGKLEAAIKNRKFPVPRLSVAA